MSIEVQAPHVAIPFSAAEVAKSAIDAAPFVTVIGSVITWLGFIVVICCIGKYIMRGAAMAVTELFLTSDNETCEKIARWFARDSEIKWCLTHLIEKLGDDPKQGLERC